MGGYRYQHRILLGLLLKVLQGFETLEVRPAGHSLDDTQAVKSFTLLQGTDRVEIGSFCRIRIEGLTSCKRCEDSVQCPVNKCKGGKTLIERSPSSGV